MKTHIKFSAILAAMLGTAGVLFALLTAHAASPEPVHIQLPSTPAPKSTPEPVKATPVAAAPAAPSANLPAATNHVGVLDNQRQFALSMIETGINDHEVGRAGEVSRYQIMPSVWRHYSQSHAYSNPDVSVEVARQHWADLYDSFKRRAHREPTDFDMYVLWNTRYGYYAKCGFSPRRLQAVVRDRAQRFVNLVELANAQYASR